MLLADKGRLFTSLVALWTIRTEPQSGHVFAGFTGNSAKHHRQLPEAHFVCISSPALTAYLFLNADHLMVIARLVPPPSPIQPSLQTTASYRSPALFDVHFEVSAHSILPELVNRIMSHPS